MPTYKVTYRTTCSTYVSAASFGEAVEMVESGGNQVLAVELNGEAKDQPTPTTTEAPAAKAKAQAITKAEKDALVDKWRHFPKLQAAEEGWAIMYDGFGITIQSDDGTGAFSGDAAAINFVRSKAASGSAYHIEAMSLVTDTAA